jgi:hypothetical protein
MAMHTQTPITAMVVITSAIIAERPSASPSKMLPTLKNSRWVVMETLLPISFGHCPPVQGFV